MRNMKIIIIGLIKVALILVVSFNVNAQASFDQHKNIVYVSNSNNPSLQSLDIYSPRNGSKLPVVLFVHGGGWTTGDKKTRSHFAKRDFFIRNNMVFVSINYRMAPQFNFPAYPQDVASAISFVKNNIQKYKGDANNIFLMGHSAGAHLAALASIDDRYLSTQTTGAKNVSLKDIKGTMLLDGAGYDIPMVLENNKKKKRKKMYVNAFGSTKNEWANASPITHISPNKNIPPFLIFYVQKRKIAEEQTTNFGSALSEAGVSVKVVPIKNSSHKKINVSFGLKKGIKERAVLNFIAQNKK